MSASETCCAFGCSDRPLAGRRMCAKHGAALPDVMRQDVTKIPLVAEVLRRFPGSMIVDARSPDDGDA